MEIFASTPVILRGAEEEFVGDAGSPVLMLRPGVSPSFALFAAHSMGASDRQVCSFTRRQLASRIFCCRLRTKDVSIPLGARGVDGSSG